MCSQNVTKEYFIHMCCIRVYYKMLSYSYVPISCIYLFTLNSVYLAHLDGCGSRMFNFFFVLFREFSKEMLQLIFYQLTWSMLKYYDRCSVQFREFYRIFTSNWWIFFHFEWQTKQPFLVCMLNDSIYFKIIQCRCKYRETVIVKGVQHIRTWKIPKFTWFDLEIFLQCTYVLKAIIRVGRLNGSLENILLSFWYRMHVYL